MTRRRRKPLLSDKQWAQSEPLLAAATEVQEGRPSVDTPPAVPGRDPVGVAPRGALAGFAGQVPQSVHLLAPAANVGSARRPAGYLAGVSGDA
jgi:hypothetical protein